MTHIDDGTLELYALGRVSSFEIVALEEHLLICPLCRARLQRLAEFAVTMREAARIIVSTELIATHRTDDGFVHLYVRRAAPDNWVATIRGDTIGGGVSAPTRSEAVELCTANFKEMFPEHRCNRGCTIIPATEA